MTENYLNGTYKPFLEILKLKHNKADAACRAMHVGAFDIALYKGVEDSQILKTLKIVGIFNSGNYYDAAAMTKSSEVTSATDLFRKRVKRNMEFIWEYRNDPNSPKFFCAVFVVPGKKQHYNVFSVCMREPKDSDYFSESVIDLFVDDMEDEILSDNIMYLMLEDNLPSPEIDLWPEINLTYKDFAFAVDLSRAREDLEDKYEMVGYGTPAQLETKFQEYFECASKAKLIAQRAIEPLVVLFRNKDELIGHVAFKVPVVCCDKDGKLLSEYKAMITRNVGIISAVYKFDCFGWLFDKQGYNALTTKGNQLAKSDKVDKFLNTGFRKNGV